MPQSNAERLSITNESNVLLDPEVLPDLSTQALVLTVLATLVKYSNDEQELRVLYQYLAEGSVVFRSVFSVMYVTNAQLRCGHQIDGPLFSRFARPPPPAIRCSTKRSTTS